ACAEKLRGEAERPRRARGHGSRSCTAQRDRRRGRVAVAAERERTAAVPDGCWREDEIDGAACAGGHGGAAVVALAEITARGDAGDGKRGRPAVAQRYGLGGTAGIDRLRGEGQRGRREYGRRHRAGSGHGDRG